MSKPVDHHDATGIMHTVPGVGIIMAHGTAVPDDDAVGYAEGCVFINRSSTTLDTALYINVGDVDAADFDPMLGAS